MKLKKLLSILPIFALFLGACSEKTVAPTKLGVASNEVKLIVNSERDLNDIVTLRFEPKNTSNKSVTWSSEPNDIFTLTGSTIKANKIGSATVTATSVENSSLYVDVTIKVYDPNSKIHAVSVNESDEFAISGLESEYEEGNEVVFTINVNDSNKTIDEVKVNNDVLIASSGTTYKFYMPNTDVNITVTLKEKEYKKATSVILNPSTLELSVGEDASIMANVTPNDTTDVASWSVIEGEDCISIEPNGNIVNVHAIKEGTTKVKVSYNENVSAECLVTIKEKTNPTQTLAKYNIKYDLGTRKTSKLIETNEQLFETFELDGENGIITSISQMDYIYGGGYGGSGETNWYTGNMLKFGTTSVNGSLTFALNAEVNRIKITGYVSSSSSKIQVGDSDSSDWTDENNDNKTALFTCSDMNEATKDVVENNQTSTITIDFANTKNLKIATTNKKPLYITSIEFIICND